MTDFVVYSPKDERLHRLSNWIADVLAQRYAASLSKSVLLGRSKQLKGTDSLIVVLDYETLRSRRSVTDVQRLSEDVPYDKWLIVSPDELRTSLRLFQAAAYISIPDALPEREAQRRLLSAAHSVRQPPEEAPTGLLRYKLLSNTPLGDGGRGTVYLARDVVTGDTVALKTYDLRKAIDAADSKEMIAAFVQEAKLLSQLQHKNVVAFRDFFSARGQCFLVMDFIEGWTLEDVLYVRKEQLSINEVVAIGIKLCSVLSYLHKQAMPIIYRDLKPANIMLTPTGDVKLIDFGIARTFKSGKQQDTIALGTPGYYAPELLRAQQTTPRSDVYSLGIVLWEMLVGESPAGGVPDVSQVRHVGLRALLTTMLVATPDNRPSIRTVAYQLRDFYA